MLHTASGGPSTARTRTWLAVAEAVVAAWLVCPASAPAATAAFPPEADAYVTSRYPDANYGKKQTLVTDARPTRVSYLRFDVSVPAGAEIEGAKLKLYARTDSTPVGFLVDAISDTNWRETDITFSNAPSSDVSSLTITSPFARRLRSRACDPFCPREAQVSARGRATRYHRTGRTFKALRLASSGGWSSSGYQSVDLPASAIRTGLNSFAASTTSTAAEFFDSREGAHQPRLEVTYSAGDSQPPDGQTPSGGRGGAIAPPGSGALFGAWVSGNTGYTVDQREAQIGRKFGIVHRYHGWTEQFPDPSEIKWAQSGRTLYLSWDARVFATNAPTRWSSIADGSQDAVIDAQAARIRSLGEPVFMDFSQEPETEVDDGRYGSPADFAAAFRHIVERFRAEGVTNVAWVWSVMGYSGYYRYYTGGLYPGDDVVDWIGWDPYNWYRCHDSAWTSFEDKVRTFYDWLSQNGHGDKPFMLSEYGTRESDVDPQAKQRWFVDGLAALKSGAFPNLKALVYFDSHPKACNWRIDSSKAALDGFRQLANDSYFSP